jgi:nitrogen fixation NifU-like protein
MTDTLYHELILDLCRHPLNKGVLKTFDKKFEMRNALCSDSVCIYLKTDGKIITDISWDGEGCALSVASTSLLTDLLRNKPIETLDSLNQNKVLDLLHLKDLNPSRLRCALLPLEALKQTK